MGAAVIQDCAVAATPEPGAWLRTGVASDEKIVRPSGESRIGVRELAEPRMHPCDSWHCCGRRRRPSAARRARPKSRMKFAVGRTRWMEGCGDDGAGMPGVRREQESAALQHTGGNLRCMRAVRPRADEPAAIRAGSACLLWCGILRGCAGAGRL